jgi:(hydroxyamino)benzene mutase
MWHGMLLFLLGSITGLLEQRFTNVRMGLSAHLEGVMNGILLLRSVPHGTRYGCLIR